MHWNRSGESVRETGPKRRAGMGRLAAAGCIAAAMSAAWMAVRGTRRGHEGTPADVRAEAAGPAAGRRVSRPAAEANAAAAERRPKGLPPQRVGEIRDGHRLLCDGRLHRVLGVVTNAPGRFSVADRTFRHSADIELGNLLLVEPGDELLGDGAGMYRGFREELLEALEDDIVCCEGDTPFQRELKGAVRELREELRRRMADGEDVERVMEDTRSQLRELSLYRRDLEDEVRRLSSGGMTQKDYEDLVGAANEMLAERGVKALEMPRALRHAVRLKGLQDGETAETGGEGR